MSTDLYKNVGLTRTDMHCTNCAKQFTASIDFSLNGNHIVECPWCGHYHYRVIVDGKVTEERHNSDHRDHVVEKRYVWKSTSQPIVTSAAHAFIRDRWLNREY